MLKLLVTLEPEQQRIGGFRQQLAIAHAVESRVKHAMNNEFPRLESQHPSTQVIVGLFKEHGGKLVVVDPETARPSVVRLSIKNGADAKETIKKLRSTPGIVGVAQLKK